MASTLVETVGGTSSNTYVTQAEATTYFGDRMNVTKWTDATSAEKDIALLQATRRLDVERFEGFKDSTGQALEWPRTEAFDFDGEEYDSSAIPVIVKRAQMELALWLLNQGTTDPLQDTGLEGFNRAKVGGLEVEPRHNRKAGALPQVVRDLLRPVLRSAVGRIVLA